MIALPLALLALSLPVPQDPVDPQAVNEAIDRGVAYLSELFDGSKKQKRIDTDRPGMRALILYTLLKSGAAKDEPAIETLLEQLSFDDVDGTYDLACLMLALGAHDPVAHRPWLESLTRRMVSWQHEGEWAYPDGTYDLSNTQYAALGLWAAERSGVPIEPRVWRELAEVTLLYQDPDGAFSYTRPGKGGYGSMTAAGVGTLALCEMHLARGGGLTEAEARRLGDSRKRGLAWLDKFFSVETNPKNGGWHYYYLYGLERMGGLAGTTHVGEHDWYDEGARYLLAGQDEEGSWTNGADLSETCFALLFLRRATSADTAPRVPKTGRDREPDGPRDRTEDRKAAVQIAIEEGLPLKMWIDGFGRAATQGLEWPGETGRGPHVSRVEWLADGEVVAIRLANDARPANGARFTARVLFERTGEVELVARVHVTSPGGESTTIESPPLTVGIEQALPAWMSEAASPAGDDLLAAGKPKARGSSTLKKPTKLEPPLPDRKFTAELAIDGKPNTPWLADAKDDEPKLSISLKKPQEADLVLVSHASLAPARELALPLEVEVRVNKRDVHVLPVTPDRGRTLRIELEKTTRVKSIDVILRGRQGDSTAPLGIGEVELR